VSTPVSSVSVKDGVKVGVNEDISEGRAAMERSSEPGDFDGGGESIYRRV